MISDCINAVLLSSSVYLLVILKVIVAVFTVYMDEMGIHIDLTSLDMKPAFGLDSESKAERKMFIMMRCPL